MKLSVNNDCIVCSYCSRACPVRAPYFDGDKMAINHEKCIGCGQCVDACWLGCIFDEENPPKPPVPHAPVSLECDALIIGAGTSGMTAAVRIAEQTNKKVIVLEKAKKSGSGGLYAMGVHFFDTQWEKEAGQTDEIADECIKVAMNTTHYELNPKLVYNTFHTIPKYFDWLCEWAEPKEGGYRLVDFHRDGRLVPEYFGPLSCGGEFIMRKLFQRAGELGVSILHETAARDLILDESGSSIVGVVADDPGGTVMIKAPVCLIAAGSLIHSQVLKRVLPDFADAFSWRFGHASPVHTGDGVEMAERAGIPIDYENITLSAIAPLCMPCDQRSVAFGFESGQHIIPPDLSNHVARAETLKVNLNGQRWISEQYFSETWRKLLKQPQCVSFTVMDSKIMEMPVLPGKPMYFDSGCGRNTAGAVPRAGKEPNPLNVLSPIFPMGEGERKISPEVIEWFSNLPGQFLMVADTLEELAEKMGVPADAFTAAVKRYNELCAKGLDEDFYKDPSFLYPLEKPPYYAIKAFLMHDGAMGGLQINENMQVLGKDGPVNGLYAAGDNTAGRFINMGGQKYQIINDNTWAAMSGFIAGDSMAKESV